MRVNYDHSAAHGAQWQDLELILLFCRLLQHGSMHARVLRVVYASHRPTETFMHACLTVGPRKLHVSVHKNAQTIIS